MTVGRLTSFAPAHLNGLVQSGLREPPLGRNDPGVDVRATRALGAFGQRCSTGCICEISFDNYKQLAAATLCVTGSP
jgi:hypothetical protein